MTTAVIDKLLAAADRYADHPFLLTRKESITYAEAWAVIHKLAAAVESVAGDAPLVGVLAQRDVSAYYGTLAVIAAGRGYVSMTAKNPAERLRKIVQRAELKTVIVGDGMEDVFLDVFHNFSWSVTGIAVTPQDTSRQTKGQATLVDMTAAPQDKPQRVRSVQGDDILYLLFTSGSTGEPKGVPVSNGNVSAYLDFVCHQYGYGLGDKVSQTFDLSFDLSVHDMLCTWTTGAALVPFTDGDLLSPARLLRDMGVTCWFSVPSQAALMARMRLLKPGAFPDLRVSLFCGEALPVRTAEDWSAAAPNGIVENLYGPTEATIAITRYAWTKESAHAARRGLVPIGVAFDGQCACPSAEGELMLSGSQVFKGYWNDPETTAQKLSDAGYHTGDLVECDDNGVLHFVGRMDSQIKLRGHRIELSEVESVLRNVAGTDMAVALAWPTADGEVLGITAVVAGAGSTGDIQECMRQHVPPYMVPARIVFMDVLPRNTSGKIDRKDILNRLARAEREKAA
ncbi:MAG: AMP-binding protein [Alphaproteobacteria bacterium]|nr:AMP-binding protein [Alphaproteobacteria bacterium]